MTEQPLVSLEAADLVLGARNADYGHPLDDFSATAEFWTTYLRRKGIIPADHYVCVEAEDIGPMMILVKLSRQAEKSKRDNLVDICGYANTTQMVEEERRLRGERFWAADDEEEEAEDTPLCPGEGECCICADLHANVQENPLLSGFGEAVESALAHELGLTAGDLSPRESFPRSAPARLAELFSLLMLG